MMVVTIYHKEIKDGVQNGYRHYLPGDLYARLWLGVRSRLRLPIPLWFGKVIYRLGLVTGDVAESVKQRRGRARNL